MNTLQLYINNERVELFSDESISVTSSIQNVRDISKIFTDFSKDFTLPATKINNRIFKHYYNYDVVDGFDARVRQEALLRINNFDFRKGKIALLGVNMKNNLPSSYRVVFYGSTVTLPDLMGEDRLKDLPYLDTFSHEYGESAVEAKLMASGDVIYPLITHTKRLYFDSTGTTTEDGNLYFDASYSDRGVNYTDLKPAIKVNRILDAIQNKYGLTFSSTFFAQDWFDSLFMWMHRKQGGLTVADGVTVKDSVKNWQFVSGYDFVFIENDVLRIVPRPQIAGATNDVVIEYTITPKSSNKYNIYIYEGNDILEQRTDVTGEQIFSNTFTNPTADIKLKVYVETSNGLTGYDAKFTILDTVETPNGIIGEDSAVYEAINQSLISSIKVTENMPDMKVIDFLTGIFKLFNLTSYVNEDGTIYIETLDYFYNNPANAPHNITNYVFSEGHKIDRALPYKKIEFKFAETSTYLATKRNQIIGGSPYGNIFYDGGTRYDGGDYVVELPFEKILYERLSNQGTGDLTKIAYGWFVGYDGDVDNVQPALGKPLLFFNKVTTTSDGISWTGSEHKKITEYNRPSNSFSNSFNDAFAGIEFYTPIASLNFSADVDDFYVNHTNTLSLFKVYYSRYIGDVFNSKARLFTYQAKLPNKFLLKYKLNDIIVINGRSFIINQIETDLLSGISSLQLINKV